jgi:hypothetical protein
MNREQINLLIKLVRETNGVLVGTGADGKFYCTNGECARNGVFANTIEHKSECIVGIAIECKDAPAGMIAPSAAMVEAAKDRLMDTSPFTLRDQETRNQQAREFVAAIPSASDDMRVGYELGVEAARVAFYE